MKYSAFALMFGVGLFLSGCALPGGGAPEARPEDFHLAYHWREGSLPPPYHYEYDITIGPGAQGEIVFRPDYSGDEVPTWREPITLTEADLDALYALAREKGVFSQRWREESDSPIGGSYDWVEVTASGRQIKFPSFLADRAQTQAAQEFYEAIRAAVPEEIWNKLEAQRQQYEREYLEREG